MQPVDGVVAEGLELYLDVADIADRAAMDGVVRAIETHVTMPDFALLIEGPVPSLDGAFFDVTRNSPDDRLVVERLAELTRRLDVKGVNIHLISASDDLSRLDLTCRATLLEQAVPFVRHFVDVTRAAGAVPTIENMPPVVRMRAGGYFFTPIGMASEDLLWMVDRVPGLEILPDTSHACLYLNARAQAQAEPENRGLRPGRLETSTPWLGRLLAYLRRLPSEPDSLLGYMQRLGPHVANAQVSNATDILGEGVPYAEGDFHLDPIIRWLSGTAHHIVTETLEPDPNEARTMRDTLRHMRAVLA
jgi:hypothetical protein